ncbi:hypothetical protein 32HC_85 [Mycobacterium phage 32HC]|uniref:Uncharacterized protein n=1 Tax=Mycobacterium phage 32HC TaxID=1445729 RepID=W8EAH4_9CAUD|nr:hypothetical protein ST32HC_85 [Mycobacterium phage 32HC]AHJ86363.1 hypothetical protein 32HC_85 [Mycobacterium phage 32HC]
MPTPLRDRIAFWLERFSWLHPILLRYDGAAPNNRARYVNRINGHVIVKPPIIYVDQIIGVRIRKDNHD